VPVALADGGGAPRALPAIRGGLYSRPVKRDTERAVFISHIHEDRVVARWLREQLRDDFLGQINVFVSSEREGHAGEDWLQTIDDALRDCRLLIALCSPVSILRPWVNFELGAAWMLEKRIVPACHAGLAVEDLKAPLSALHGVALTEAAGIETLYATIALQLGFPQAPRLDFAELAEALRSIDAAPADGDDAIELQMLQRDRDVRARVRRALEAKGRWRTIPKIATEAAVSKDAVLEILRADGQVRFCNRERDGALVAGLVTRVGP
jgi:hypothetical protein